MKKPLDPDVATFRVKQSKAWRSQLDTILQEMKAQQEGERSGPPHDSGRHLALTITATEDAIMRLGMRMKAVRETNPNETSENPYPQSYNPENAQVEPTSGDIKL